MAPPYKKPPIVEAVIGIRLDQPLERQQIERLRAEFHDDYPHAEGRANVLFTAQVGASSVQEVFDGYILRSNSALESIVVGAQDFTTVSLPPYPGFDMLLPRALHNYNRFRQVIGYRKIARIGVRFVNRIDIPRDESETEVMLSRYFNVSPDSMNIIPDFKYENFFMSLRIKYDGPISVLLQTGIAPPALVRHLSFMLDIDAFLEGETVPQSEAKIVEILTRLRSVKNDVFERSITDEARHLFEAEE